MVFGFFEAGKIDINLAKLNYSKGEEIVGEISLTPKNPIKARGVKVTLYSETTSTQVTSSGMSKSTRRTFEFAMPLDGEKEYSPTLQKYEFKIKIPSDSNIAPEGLPGQIAQAVKFISTGNQVTKWFIEAKLDIPGGFDINKKVQINVG